MAGISQGDSGVRARRELHVTGTLGFHSPYIVPADRPYSKQELAQAFDFAVVNIARFVDLSARYDDSDTEETSLVPRYIIVNALRTSPADFFYIDTVEKALRAGISLEGALEPPFDAASARNRCENRWLIRNSRKGPVSRAYPISSDLMKIMKAPPSEKQGRGDRWFGIIYPFDAGEYFIACLVLPTGINFEPAHSPDDLPKILKVIWQHEPEFFFHEEPWWGFARTTPITAIAKR